MGHNSIQVWGSPWQIAIASGWELEGPGFKPRRLQANFDPGLAKETKKNIPSLIVCLQ